MSSADIDIGSASPFRERMATSGMHRSDYPCDDIQATIKMPNIWHKFAQPKQHVTAMENCGACRGKRLLMLIFGDVVGGGLLFLFFWDTV